MFVGDYLVEVVATAFSTILAGLTWLVRTVLTNQKQIALQQQQVDMLKKEIADRDLKRKEDRQVLMEVQKDVKEVKRDIMELYRDKL